MTMKKTVLAALIAAGIGFAGYSISAEAAPIDMRMPNLIGDQQTAEMARHHGSYRDCPYRDDCRWDDDRDDCRWDDHDCDDRWDDDDDWDDDDWDDRHRPRRHRYR